jgi:hypothetical protein
LHAATDAYGYFAGNFERDQSFADGTAADSELLSEVTFGRQQRTNRKYTLLDSLAK